jgi:hypothetical protein
MISSVVSEFSHTTNNPSILSVIFVSTGEKCMGIKITKEPDVKENNRAGSCSM